MATAVKKRAQQREETRDRIVEAAALAFAELGFAGASTREIARRAGTNQGLITYHFRSKDELWRAAADRIFGQLEEGLGEPTPAPGSDDPRERAREAIRAYVRYAAAHPELLYFMIEMGRSDGPHMQWLVDNHLKRFYGRIPEPAPPGAPSQRPHLFYALTGAASVIFAVQPECRRLTGLDPGAPDAVEAHAEFVARLLVP